ncbi:hypothetical protein [Parabacteroides johnsonii]
MNKGTAKKLDDILSKIIESGGQDHEFYFNTSEELYDFEDYLEILDKNKYIITWGTGERSCVVFISPKGRMFIKNGGYTSIIEEKERKDRLIQEHLQLQKRLIEVQNNANQTYLSTDETKSKKGFLGLVAAIVGGLGALDGCFNGFQLLKRLITQLLSLI